jgi:hypothetical protein
VKFQAQPSPANWGERPVTGAVQAYRRKHWFPLRFNQLMGVRWRGRLFGSRGRRRRAPDPLNLVCLRRFLAAVLRIVRARSGPSSPSFVGACGPEILLRRSCVADFLRRFSVPCPYG